MIDQHLADEEVAAYLDRGLSADEQARVEAHLAVCSRCRMEVVDLNRLVRKEAHEEPARKPVPQVRGRWWMPLGAIAAAAVLGSVILGPPAVELREESTRVRDEAVYSGASGTIEIAVPPSGAWVDRDSLTFRWEPMPQDPLYQFTLTGSDGALLWTTNTEQSLLRLPQEVTAQLEPEQRYYWRVDALLPDLSSATSGDHAFGIARE